MNLQKRIPSWPVYPLGIAPAIWNFWAAVSDRLGADPLARLEHVLGEWALIFLILTLAVTPLRRFAKINLIKYRRALGLVAFAYIVCHANVYIALDRQFDFWEIWIDILKRPYITIGTGAFLILIPLAITSNNASIRKLGAQAWRKLHWLVYPAALMGAVHYTLLKKTWQAEPLIYLAVIAFLIALRFVPKRSAARG